MSKTTKAKRGFFSTAHAIVFVSDLIEILEELLAELMGGPMKKSVYTILRRVRKPWGASTNGCARLSRNASCSM